MIEYLKKLPSLFNGEERSGTYNNVELVLPSFLSTTSHDLGDFLHILHNNIADERRLIFIEGKMLPVLHSWIRDDVHIMKGAKHFDYRIKDYLEFIIKHQSEEGFYYELIKQLDDPHHLFVNEDCRIVFDEDNLALTRLELEADVEYLVVEGVYQYYRSSGDLDFVKEVLPSLEKAIKYMITSPKRFSKEYGLIIRPYTIDTWDFVNNPNTCTDRRIHDDEVMCAMHGDNSGVYQAMNLLAFFNDKLSLGNGDYWRKEAEILKKNIFKYLWNGKFFIHQLPINGKPYDELENIRLSLSNPYDINRGLTDFEQSSSIIKEYQNRKKTTDAFCEYFSIDPAYESFIQYKKGEYVNGSISPFTAGELALASFNNGFEEYGYEIIKTMKKLCLRDNSVSFLYNLDGTSQDKMGPSAWGAASILNAIDEGLFGIVDLDCLYKSIKFSPKMVLTEYKQTRFFTGYEQNNILVDVRYMINEEGFRYDLYSKNVKDIDAEILLPKGKTISKVVLNDKEIDFSIKKVNKSNYVCFKAKHNDVTSIILYY